MQKPRLIAEVAKLHFGDMNKAKEMISLCAEHGVTGVKFQSYDQSDINKNHENFSKDYKCHLTIEELYELSQVAKRNKLTFHCSAFSKSVLEPLSKFTDVIKIPSTFFSKLDFIGEATKYFNEIHISTGFHSFEDTAMGMAELVTTYPRHRFIFYHCVSEYPNTRFNLQRIERLNMHGYSHHSHDISPLLYAWFLGANNLEFHVMANKFDSKLWCVSYDSIKELNKKIEDFKYYYEDKDNSDIEKSNYEFFKTEFKDLL